MCLTRKKCVSLTKIPFSSNRQESIIEHRWSDFGQFCELNNLREVIIDGDGYCFPNAVRKCLMHDFYKFYTIQQIQDIVCEHLAHNFEEYVIFHHYSCDELIEQAKQFFNEGQFNRDIVDISRFSSTYFGGAQVEIFLKYSKVILLLLEA